MRKKTKEQQRGLILYPNIISYYPNLKPTPVFPATYAPLSDVNGRDHGGSLLSPLTVAVNLSSFNITCLSVFTSFTNKCRMRVRVQPLTKLVNYFPRVKNQTSSVLCDETFNLTYVRLFSATLFFGFFLSLIFVYIFVYIYIILL